MRDPFLRWLFFFLLFGTTGAFFSLAADPSIRPGSGHFPGIDLVDPEAGQIPVADVRELPPEKLLSPAKHRFGLLLFSAFAILYLLLRAWVGSTRGWVREICGLAPVIVFLYLTFWAGGTHFLIDLMDARGSAMPMWLLHFLAATFLLGSLFLLFSALGFLLTRLYGRGEEGQLKMSWRIAGGIFGGLVGSTVILVILTALYTFSTFAWFFHSSDERPHFLTRFLLTSRQTIEGSFLSPVIQRLEPLQARDYATLSTIRLARQEELLAAIMDETSPWHELQRLTSVASILEDEELMQRLNEGRYLHLLLNTDVRRALRDPLVHETIERLAQPESRESDHTGS